MADPARGSADSPAGWDLGTAKEAVVRAAAGCDGLTAADLRSLSEGLRRLVFTDAMIEADAARRAGEILAAAGMVPPPRGRHLRAVR